MFKPLFNQALVEVDTESDKWGTGNDDSMLGKDYREGTVVEYGQFLPTKDYPKTPDDLELSVLAAPMEHIMWNQGHEAGKTFEHDGKLYAFVYWWDLVGVKDEG